MEERKLNRIKVVLVEKDKTGKWLAEELNVGTTTVVSLVPEYHTARHICS